MIRFSFWIFGMLALSLLLDCKKKVADEDMQDCDKIFNYYEGGSHYIRRDLIGEEGNWDYEKLLEDSKIKRSDCYPAKDSDVNVDLKE